MLIPKGRQKILEVFLNNPLMEAHLREIARLSKVSVTNVDSSLRLLVKYGLFKKRAISNMTFFRPNLESDSLLKVFELLELERRSQFYKANKQIARLLKKYSQDIIKLSKRRIQLVILFGSVARGEWTKDSDIDVLAVVTDRGKEVTSALSQAKKKIEPLLEINPISTTIDQFQEGIRKNSEFYDELWDDRVVLYNEFLFWQMVKEGKMTHV